MILKLAYIIIIPLIIIVFTRIYLLKLMSYPILILTLFLIYSTFNISFVFDLFSSCFLLKKQGSKLSLAQKLMKDGDNI